MLLPGDVVTTGLIFLGAIALYAAFRLWYRGPARALTSREVEAAVAKASKEISPDPYQHDWNALSSERFQQDDAP